MEIDDAVSAVTENESIDFVCFIKLGIVLSEYLALDALIGDALWPTFSLTG